MSILFWSYFQMDGGPHLMGEWLAQPDEMTLLANTMANWLSCCSASRHGPL